MIRVIDGPHVWTYDFPELLATMFELSRAHFTRGRKNAETVADSNVCLWTTVRCITNQSMGADSLIETCREISSGCVSGDRMLGPF